MDEKDNGNNFTSYWLSPFDGCPITALIHLKKWLGYKHLCLFTIILTIFSSYILYEVIDGSHVLMN